MIIVQEPWTPLNAKAAGDALAAARRTLTQVGPVLALLAHADGAPAEAVDEEDLIAALSGLARDHGLYLGASACVRVAGEDAPRTVGMLVDPDGAVLIRAPKVLPDIVEGYTDTVAATFTPFAPQIARTPVGQIAVLCGEDVLFPQLVRGAVTSGAEIILNPARERRDQHFEARRTARQARAYENICYVATASPTSVTMDGARTALAPAAQVAEYWGTTVAAGGPESAFTAILDLDALRRRRQEPMGNFPAVVRMPLYAPGYAAAAGPARATPSTRAGWLKAFAARAAASPRPAVPEAREERYEVVLCQCVSARAAKPQDLPETRMRNLEAAIEVVNSVARAPSVRLVVFPEFFVTGATSPFGNNSAAIAQLIGITFPGPEADRLAKFAQDTKSFVAGGVFEFDPAWPGRFFNSAFIFDDGGNLVHLYRKIHCGDVMGMLPDTTPGSVYDQYVQKYGYERLFPVADTRIGMLATKVCFDMNFAETSRAFVARGAEIIIHPTSEPHNIRRRAWDMGRHTRAFENTAYVLTAGHGGEFRPGGLTPYTMFNRGYSKIVNFDGTLQTVADGPGAVPLQGSIDLKALRAARADAKTNLAAWDDAVAYQALYAAGRGMPNNLWTGSPEINPYEKSAELRKVIAAYTRDGVYVAPEA